MRFAPVHLPEDRALGDRCSQTLLRQYSRCPRAGYLARCFDSAPTAEMARGTAVHLIYERALQTMIENGEAIIPPEIVKAIAEEVLAEVHVPVEEHDQVREMSYRLATELIIDPAAVVAVETLFALDVPVRCPRCGGSGSVAGEAREPVECPRCGSDGTVTFEVRCRVDFAQLAEGGAVVVVEDVKSSKAAVPFEEMSRTRPDGSLAAKSFQLILYAIALAYGVPVREEDCAACGATGYKPGPLDVDNGGCEACGGNRWSRGKGRIETREPFPVASRAQRFDLAYVYPAIENAEGKMVRRPVSLTRLEVETYRQSLSGLVARLAASEETGDWPALVSDAACGECPASALCPIPKELKDHRGTINTVGECAEALEVRFREKKTQAARAKEIRAFVKARGPVVFGGGMVAELGHTESTRIVDKEGMFDAVDRAVHYGEPYERERYVKTVESFPLVERALTADELLAMASESEGSSDDESGGRDGGAGAHGGGGGRGGGGLPVSRDDFAAGGEHRFGDDAPF